MQKVLRRSGQPTPRTLQIQKTLGGTKGRPIVKKIRWKEAQQKRKQDQRHRHAHFYPALDIYFFALFGSREGDERHYELLHKDKEKK